MIKHVLTLFFVILFLAITTFAFQTNSYSQTTQMDGNKVLYMLPYPGILPDHPFYFLKAIRDRILDFTTRDTMKKAALYLQFSDKRMGMSLELLKKGKNKLAVDTYAKGEKYFMKIPGLLSDSKKQGVAPQSEFINTLRLSNAKHKEVGEILIKETTDGEVDEINASLKINKQIADAMAAY